MRDIDLWEGLGDGSLETGEAIELLEHLARLPIARRAPFWARIGPSLAAESPELRAAAVSVLAGARGLRGVREIVRLLDDPDSRVREAAVSAMRSSADGPGRWAHVLFHANAPVRRIGINTPAPRVPPILPLALLADPVTADLVRGQLRELVTGGEWIPTLLDYVDKGVLAAEDLRAALDVAWITNSPRRLFDPLPMKVGNPRARTELEDFIVTRDAFTHFDDLDRLFELFWTHEDSFARRLATASGRKRLTAEDERRIAWALARVGARAPDGWSPHRLALLAAVMPVVLSHDAISLELRREAALQLPSVGGVSRVADPFLHLETSELLLPGGRLSLRHGLALAARASGNSFRLLRQKFGSTLKDAVLREPAAARNLFALEVLDDDLPFLQSLVTAWLAEDRTPMELAMFVTSLPRDALAARIHPTKLLQMTDALVRLDAVGDLRLGTNKRSRTFSMLAPALAAHALKETLELLLEFEGVEKSPFALELLFEVAVATTSLRVAKQVRALANEHQHRLVDILTDSAMFPLAHLHAIAFALRSSDDPRLVAWATTVIEPELHERQPADVSILRRMLGAAPERTSKALHKRIVEVDAPDLPDALRPIYEDPSVGLCDALDARPVAEPDPEVCAALLLCDDPPERVAKTMTRYRRNSGEFWGALESLMVRRAAHSEGTGWLACAWLHLWERRLERFTELSLKEHDGLVGALRESLTWTCETLTVQVWRAVGRQLAIWKARDKAKFAKHVSRDLAELAVAELPRIQRPAAVILVQLVRGRFDPPFMDRLEAKVAPLLGRLQTRCRKELSQWFDVSGVKVSRAHATVDAADRKLLAEVERTRDLDRLGSWLRHPDLRVVEEALLRLDAAGEDGRSRVVSALSDVLVHPRTVCSVISAWSEGESLDRVRTLLLDDECPVFLRFLLAITLFDRGERAAWNPLVKAVCAQSDHSWFLAEDYDRIVPAAGRLAIGEEEVAEAFVVSPQVGVYVRACETLMTTTPIAAEPLRVFLRIGEARLASLRRRVAHALKEVGDYTGFPLLFSERFVDTGKRTESIGGLLDLASGELARDCGRAYAMAGESILRPRAVLTELATVRDADAREDAYLEILHSSHNAAIHAWIFDRMRLSQARYGKLQRLAETFAWGVRQGVRLTGRKFAIRMIGGDAFANTRLTRASININPLPLLRGDRDGGTVVRGLILHELGHHVHHGGPDALKIWSTAQSQGLHKLLNLVADEHLERNLRANREEDGNALKTLATYAFQRRQSEIPILVLLEVLGVRAFETLKNAKLDVARSPDSVGLRLGETLRSLEGMGSSFTRFFRGLRMGLGNRHNDPKVEEALALFSGAQFRQQDMAGLWEIAQELHRIFGDDVKQLEVFDQHSEWGDSTDARIEGDGISDEEVQRAIDRILNPQQGKSESMRAPEQPKPAKNLGSREDFDLITDLEQVAPQPDAHRLRAQRVARLSRKMREYFERLGLRMMPRGGRVSGHAVDRERIRGLVLKGDPRMLRAREMRRTNDLFVGIVVDCSGSMAAGDSMEKAKLFGVLLAEATKGLPGIDTRFWGFTDRTIYEAGDARTCAVAALEAGGGNNDAAALWHAAQVSLHSRRRSRLLVMISDGAPTECTVDSLKHLVETLTRRHKIACAQVAVRPIDEVCFPHYVEITEGELDASVRRFGKVVQNLVTKTLGS